MGLEDMKFKRKHLNTLFILKTIDIAGVSAWEYFVHDLKLPSRVVTAALMREVKTGHLNYGVCIERAFLTESGRKKLAELNPNKEADK